MMHVLRRFKSVGSNKVSSLFNPTKRRTHDSLQLKVGEEELRFPHVWLRDNCQCELCYHKTAKSRIIDYSQFNTNAKPKSVSSDDNYVNITWDDGHTSSFRTQWLKLHSFEPKHQTTYDEEIYKPKKSTWHGRDFFKLCSKHNYNAIISSDTALFQWLHNLSVYGISLIQNTPNNEAALENIISRIGFSKQTHYGVKFIVQSVPNTSNVAYLSNNLQMHTDLPYYEYCPGVNMLHCLVQTHGEGGENLLSDCHYTANYMKENHYTKYKLLTDIEVEWSDIGTENGNEFFKLHRSPVICLDQNEDISRINFSIPQRGTHFPGKLQDVTPWYEAQKLFYDLSYKFAANFKTQEGDILVFDNIRLLHGRNKYIDNTHNIRKLIGVYIDWDEIYSRWRCLKIKLNPNNSIL
ncbi:unnamed protein product [Leptosia nina]|uniref:Gamma-butyrobetaine dioxygenase n=1 Tax=Leptosia nina TaxID=320188 RepID=A0AAV1IX80_9NEOP